MSNNRFTFLLGALTPYKAFLLKFLMLFSWFTSLFTLWVMARSYHHKAIPSFPEGLLITCVFLVFLFWSIYWIFSFSEKFEDLDKQKQLLPPATIKDHEREAFGAANSVLQKSLEQELVSAEERTKIETRAIFSKTEKIKVDQRVYNRLIELKRKTHTRVLHARHTEILAIAQLHQDIINTIDQSEHLTNIEKAEMYPDIHQFITSNKFSHWVIKEND